jgi:hypothetical protein
MMFCVLRRVAREGAVLDTGVQNSRAACVVDGVDRVNPLGETSSRDFGGESLNKDETYQPESRRPLRKIPKPSIISHLSSLPTRVEQLQPPLVKHHSNGVKRSIHPA